MNTIAKKALDTQRAAGQPSIPGKRALSRDADKFVVRLPDDLRPRVKAAAELGHRSMNTVVIEALRHYLDGQQKQDLLLNALELALAHSKSEQEKKVAIVQNQEGV